MWRRYAHLIKSTHIICDFQYDGDMGDIYTKLMRAVHVGGLNIVDEVIHHFNPHGISIILVLAESHLSVHTWEEEHTINIDIFVCGDNDPHVTLNEFLKQFKIINKHEQIITRNNLQPL